MTLPDVQSQFDDRDIGIDQVGISGLRYPIAVYDTEHGKQDTVATVSLSVSLPACRRGGHLSRLVEVLDACGGELSPTALPKILQELCYHLDARAAQLRAEFPFFRRRYAPVSRASALADYQCLLTASIEDGQIRADLVAVVPVASVCPCSKAVSDYGAHNQRGHLTVAATLATSKDDELPGFWLENLIEVAESSASSPVYPLLKRPDERHVTMAAYDNAVFAEDMARAVTERLRGDPRITSFTVEAVSDESIHNHAAFARLTWPTPPAEAKEAQQR